MIDDRNPKQRAHIDKRDFPVKTGTERGMHMHDIRPVRAQLCEKRTISAKRLAEFLPFAAVPIRFYIFDSILPFQQRILIPVPVYNGSNAALYGRVGNYHADFHSYLEPFPVRTTHTVWNKILMSSPSVQLSIYSKSSFTTSSKSIISLRPLICHRPVSPGVMLMRLR